LNLPPEEIPFFLQSLVDEQTALLKQLDEIGFYMRGGITRDQAMRLTFRERENIMKLIKENIERTHKTGIALL
jgi:hypothetical protein